MSAETRTQLRTRLRAQRQRLSVEQNEASSLRICRRISQLGAFRRANRVGCYCAFDGEPSLSALIDFQCSAPKLFFAPVIDAKDMRFAPLGNQYSGSKNDFGITEPASIDFIDPRYLDLVLVPLVAFDDRGVRLGIGRGYYDRCFRFLAHRRHWRRPRLLGVAHSFQRLPRITAQPWDIPLWAAVTESNLIVFQGG